MAKIESPKPLSVTNGISEEAKKRIFDKFANNKFINSFLQYKDFSMLTQDMAKTLINKIKVFEDNRIEIEMKFKDEFENAVKYIEDNSQ